MLTSVLIANRGEIACRVIKTARRMGLRTIAVYSDADRHARHVAIADEAHHIGLSPARESYLSVGAILDAVARSKAQSIHPGYGFLSENASFAETCEKAGIVFIGPPASAIRAMGLKDAAKQLMRKAGVPVVPGYDGDDQTAKRLADEAKKIGYPVLIKAVAGGGGKGMRRVDAPADFAKALEGAMREAKSAFGDDRVLVEKYVSRPRHIEIQVFADGHGNAVYLHERDCSLQRRHQKVLEEAPAPGMTPELRAAMGEAAVKAAKAIQYRGAGTVEFIVDSSKGLTRDGYFFMEMNTRLQVEHPVTEMISGLDLVEWQIRVASGEKLPLTQEAIPLNGHAVEARLYAEDPANNFLPSIGTLERLRLPDEDGHVRVDTGVRQGDPVTMFYDPMIAKIIAWDVDRAGAIARLTNALRTVEVAGLRSNAAFLAACTAHPEFRDGDIDTGFIDRHLEHLAPKADASAPRTLALATLFVLLERRATAAGRSDPWDRLDNFRVSPLGPELVEFTGEKIPVAVAVTYSGNGYTIAAGGENFEAAGELGADGTLWAVLNGHRMRASVVRLGRSLVVMIEGATHVLALHDPLDVDEMAEAAGAAILAPMPGKIVQVLVEKGDKVKRGQALVVLEAMKMEHTLTAPGDRVIAEVTYKAGDQVVEGAIVVAFVPEE